MTKAEKPTGFLCFFECVYGLLLMFLTMIQPPTVNKEGIADRLGAAEFLSEAFLVMLVSLFPALLGLAKALIGLAKAQLQLLALVWLLFGRAGDFPGT